MKFEGEYLNGKTWNGSGYNINDNLDFKIKDGKGNIKYYDYNDVLIFEGEYINGERNGKGKEYYENGKLRFEGEYKNEKIWNGKGYNINGNIEYEIKIGNGKVKEYNKSGKLEFEGQ